MELSPKSFGPYFEEPFWFAVGEEVPLEVVAQDPMETHYRYGSRSNLQGCVLTGWQ